MKTLPDITTLMSVSSIPYVPVSLEHLPPPPQPQRVREGDPDYDEAYEKRTKHTAGVIQEILAASGGREGLEKELSDWAAVVPPTGPVTKGVLDRQSCTAGR